MTHLIFTSFFTLPNFDRRSSHTAFSDTVNQPTRCRCHWSRSHVHHLHVESWNENAPESSETFQLPRTGDVCSFTNNLENCRCHCASARCRVLTVRCSCMPKPCLPVRWANLLWQCHCIIELPMQRPDNLYLWFFDATAPTS